ncbi:MAG: hypothetical protein U9P38_03635 [Campylobacterota bacterium]|nr:hypothetical protein [Campylobacterota bacterium]
MKREIIDVEVIENLEKIDEKEALKVFGSEENAKGTAQILKDTLYSYSNKPKEQRLQVWVEEEFKKYPQEFSDEVTIQKDAKEIVENITLFNKNREELQTHLSKGKTTQSWMAKKIEDGAKSANIVSVGNYGQKVEDALKDVNTNFVHYRYYDEKHPTHGLVAEDMANLEDAVKNNDVIHEGTNNAKDGADRIVNGQEIQTKYYETAKGTVNSTFKDGKYRYIGKDGKPMQLEVPSDQYDEAVSAMQERIKAGQVEGVTDPKQAKNLIRKGAITYKESKEIAKKLKKEKDFQERNWDKLSKTEITKSILRETGKSVVMGSLIQGGRILGGRIWNSLTGKPNKETSEDVKEWLQSSWSGAKSIGIQTAVTTGVTIAVRKGFIGTLAKNTPIGKIANIAYVGVENVKVLWKMGKGEIGFKEGMKEMASVSGSAIGGIVGAGKGAVLGATVGSAVPIVGTVIGGVIGGVLGGIAGSSVGEVIAKGATKVVSGVSSVLKSVASTVKSVGSAISNAVSSLKFW